MFLFKVLIIKLEIYNNNHNPYPLQLAITGNYRLSQSQEVLTILVFVRIPGYMNCIRTNTRMDLNI